MFDPRISWERRDRFVALLAAEASAGEFDEMVDREGIILMLAGSRAEFAQAVARAWSASEPD